jgi:predicted nucleotidyltransferase
MNMRVADIQNRILPILREHGVRRAGVFGSRARGEERPDSDLDLLVELESGSYREMPGGASGSESRSASLASLP